MIPFTGNVQGTESSSVFPGGWGNGESGITANGDRASPWSNENILEFSMVMVVQLGECIKTTELHTLKG